MRVARTSVVVAAAAIDALIVSIHQAFRKRAIRIDRERRRTIRLVER